MDSKISDIFPKYTAKTSWGLGTKTAPSDGYIVYILGYTESNPHFYIYIDNQKVIDENINYGGNTTSGVVPVKKGSVCRIESSRPSIEIVYFVGV